MEIISEDIWDNYILEFLTDYDIFTCKNVSTWWNIRYLKRRDELMLGIDIYENNDVSLIYEIHRVGADTKLFNAIEPIYMLFDETYSPLLSCLQMYPPFMKHLRSQFKYMVECVDSDLIEKLLRYILIHEEFAPILGTDSEIWTALSYGIYWIQYHNEGLSDEAIIAQRMEQLIDIIIKYNCKLDKDRICCDLDRYHMDASSYGEDHWMNLFRKIRQIE